MIEATDKMQQVKHKKMPDCICEKCGALFWGFYSNANRFCSRKCYDEVVSRPEIIEAARVLWDTDLSVRQISQKLGVTRATVAHMARRQRRKGLGFPTRVSP